MESSTLGYTLKFHHPFLLCSISGLSSLWQFYLFGKLTGDYPTYWNFISIYIDTFNIKNCCLFNSMFYMNSRPHTHPFHVSGNTEFSGRKVKASISSDNNKKPQ